MRPAIASIAEHMRAVIIINDLYAKNVTAQNPFPIYSKAFLIQLILFPSMAITS